MFSIHRIYSTFAIALIYTSSASSQGTLPETSTSWSYETGSGNTGPDNWDNMFPACNGRNQSPININTSDVKVPEKNENMVFYGYDMPPNSAFNAVNNGRSVQITIDKNLPDKMEIAAGGLGFTYILEQFHFHWGESNKDGSEHQIDGKLFGLEIHLVHYAEQFNSVEEAVESSRADAVAVLCVFVNEATDDSQHLSVGLGKIADSLQKVANQGNTTNIEVFALEDLLPAKGSRSFFRYMGSFTTPLCDEVVIWTIFNTEIYITSDQLSKFHSTLYHRIGDSTQSVLFTHNHRPVLPLGGRQVYRFTDVDSQHSSSNGVRSLRANCNCYTLHSLNSRILALLVMSVVVG